MTKSPISKENPIIDELQENMMPLIKIQQMIAQVSVTSSGSFFESILAFIDENKIISAKKILYQEFNIFFASHKYEIVNN